MLNSQNSFPNTITVKLLASFNKGTSLLKGNQNQSVDMVIVLARVMSVLMIISCHILQFYNCALAWLINVGVEIFLIISGMLYEQKDIQYPFSWIKRQWKKILIPYWLYAVIAILLYYLFCREYTTLQGCLGLLLTASRFPGLGHLWYINYILFLYLITPLLQSIYDEYFSICNENKLFSCIIGGTGILWLLNYYGLHNYEVSRIMCYIIAYVFSRHYLHDKEVDNKYSFTKIINILLIMAIPLSIMRGYIQIKHLESQIPFWNMIIPYIHSLMGFGLFGLFYNIGKKCNICNNIIGNFINQCSYEIYLVHHIFILGPAGLNVSAQYQGVPNALAPTPVTDVRVVSILL